MFAAKHTFDLNRAIKIKSDSGTFRKLNNSSFCEKTPKNREDNFGMSSIKKGL